MPNWLSDLLSEMRHRFRVVLRKRSVENDLDDEIRFHIEQEAEKLEASGLAPQEAHRQARIAFGGVERIKDDTRDVSGVSWLEAFVPPAMYEQSPALHDVSLDWLAFGFTLLVAVSGGLAGGPAAAIAPGPWASSPWKQ